MLTLHEGPELWTHYWLDREQKKAKCPTGFKPTTSLSWGVCSTVVLQPLPFVVVLGSKGPQCLNQKAAGNKVKTINSYRWQGREEWALSWSFPFLGVVECFKSRFNFVVAFSYFGGFGTIDFWGSRGWSYRQQARNKNNGGHHGVVTCLIFVHWSENYCWNY